MAKLSELGGDFELPPEGKHPGVLTEFIDLEVQPGQIRARPPRRRDL